MSEIIKERTYQGKEASKAAHRHAREAAIRWVREQHPQMWETFVEEAYASLGVSRRPVGRPSQSSPLPYRR